MNTTRRYPRTLDEAFGRGGDWASPRVMRAILGGLEDKQMGRFAHFRSTFRLYRKGGHSIIYSARIAWGCAFKGLPF